MNRIVRAEFLKAVLSGSFAVSFAGSVALFALCAFFFVSGHYEAPVRRPKPSTVSVLLEKPVSPLGFCVQDAGASAEIRPGSAGLVQAAEQERNFKLPAHLRFDWAFLVAVVFGIVGIVLSYAAINGEKEDGTLRLVLAHSIPRSRVFLGKYIALTVAATLPLLVGALMGLLIVAISGPAGVTLSHAGRISVFLLFACLYVSLVVLLSLLISSVTHRSAIAALVLLAIWAIWTFLIPGISDLLVSKVRPLPSDLEMAGRLGPMIQQEVFGKVRAILKRVEAKELTEGDEVRRQTDAAFVEGQKKLVGLRLSISRGQEARTEASRDISRLSPSAAFRYGAEALLDLGFVGLKRLRRDVERHASIYDQYVLSKMGKLVITSDWTFSVSTRIGSERLLVESPRAQEYTGDMSDFPAFTRSRRSAGEALSEAAPDLAILLGWNVALFILGLAAFNRYDVR